MVQHDTRSTGRDVDSKLRTGVSSSPSPIFLVQADRHEPEDQEKSFATVRLQSLPQLFKTQMSSWTTSDIDQISRLASPIQKSFISLPYVVVLREPRDCDRCKEDDHRHATLASSAVRRQLGAVRYRRYGRYRKNGSGIRALW